jgi:integrase-like protein/Arm domain-containing DNA-binding protein
VSDSEGLHVFIASTGSKLWRVSYRFIGKQKTLALGKYPEMSLLGARRARNDAKRLIAKSVDPAAAKAEKRVKLISASNTFQAVADEWFEASKSRWVETYSSRPRSRLDDDLFPALGKRQIAEIEPLEVLDAIRAIESRDAIEMAKRIMQMASAIFRHLRGSLHIRRQ